MKKDRQRRIIKRKKPVGQSKLLSQFVDGVLFSLGKAIGNIVIDIIEAKEEKQPIDQDMDYCKYCKTYYKDQCNCKPKQLPPSAKPY